MGLTELKDDFIGWYRNWWILRNTPGYNRLGMMTKKKKRELYEISHPLESYQIKIYRTQQALKEERDALERTKCLLSDMTTFKERYYDYASLRDVFKAMDKAKAKLKY